MDEPFSEIITTEINPIPPRRSFPWIERKFTIGNLIEIFLIIVTGIIYITRIEAKQVVIETILREHMQQNSRDAERYISRETFQAKELYDREFKEELTRRLDKIEAALAKVNR